MTVKYETHVLGEGNHASILIPEWVIQELKTNKRAPLKVTVNGHTYQSTAVGVAGECRVVFPSADRLKAKVQSGDLVEVALELDSGYREVHMTTELVKALESSHLTKTFADLSYSKRKEFARQVDDAKTQETMIRRIEKVLSALRELNEK